MMSSSDSMLLSGSSYLTRDLYRPLVEPGASEAREGWVARVGVAVFATASLVASLFAGGGGLDFLVTLGDTAFGGYAQLALPVLVALYWRGTTRAGMFAGVVAAQAYYLLHVFVPEVTVGGVTLLGGTYFGWDFALYGMLLGLVLTVVVSARTASAPGEDAARFAAGQQAD
jgi:SSS family solute:Na+ symporter